MNRVDVTIDSTVTTISLDDAVSSTDRIWGVIAVRLVDELTGRPPKGSIKLTTSLPALTPRVAENGLVGLAGVPTQVFPGLKTIGYTMDMSLQVQGYVPVRLTTTLPANPAFPATFAPLVLPDLLLHRQPIVFKGRTVRVVAGIVQPAIGVNVHISGIWRIQPPANVILPADPPNLVALHQPVYASRAHLISKLRRRDLNAIPGNDKRLLESVPVGGNVLHITNRSGLVVGGILLVDGDRPDRQEYLTIQAIKGGSTPDQIAEISLEFPTVFSHRQNSLVQTASTLGPLGPNNSLSQDAIPGDSTILLSSLAGLGTGHQVRLSGGGSVDEYHDFVQYTTQSDVNGYYRLPPVSRVAQVEMEAYDGIHTIKSIVSPDYQLPENLVDFVF
jgi:hypothetical protein